MLCFFMFFLMTVSSAPLDLVHGKQASKHVTEMMSQALFQNKTFLSELAEADPGTLNTILGLLNDLLDASEAASLAFTTDVTTALSDKDAKSDILAAAVLNQTQSTTAKAAADLALQVADLAKREATVNFDVAVLHHTAMVTELNDKQPGVDAETETLESTIALIETLLPECGVMVRYAWPSDPSPWYKANSNWKSSTNGGVVVSKSTPTPQDCGNWCFEDTECRGAFYRGSGATCMLYHDTLPVFNNEGSDSYSMQRCGAAAFVMLENGPGCGDASITTAGECGEAAASLGYEASVDSSSWGHAPLGCVVETGSDGSSWTLFNSQAGQTGSARFRSLCRA